MRRLSGTLALLLFGLLAAACNMSMQEFVDARRGGPQPQTLTVAEPRAQFIYSHAVW